VSCAERSPGSCIVCSLVSRVAACTSSPLSFYTAQMYPWHAAVRRASDEEACAALGELDFSASGDVGVNDLDIDSRLVRRRKGGGQPAARSLRDPRWLPAQSPSPPPPPRPNTHRLQPDTAAGIAASHGYAGALRLLAAAGADFNVLDTVRSARAALLTSSPLVAVGCPPTSPLSAPPLSQLGCPPLVKAVGGGHVDAVRVLLDCGASINADAVSCACAAPSPHIHGPPCRAPSQEGTTPLMAAAGAGDVAMLDLLLSYGADVNALAQVSWQRASRHRVIAGRCSTGGGAP